MAITKQNEQAAPATQSPQAQSINQTASVSTQGNTTEKLTMRTLRKSPISRGGVSEIAHQIATRFKSRFDEFTEEDDKKTYRVSLFDNKTSKCYYSVVLVIKRVPVDKKDVCVVYGLLVEASAARLQPRSFNYNGQQYSLQTAPSDAIDKNLSNRIVDHVKGIYGAEIPVAIASLQVLPSEFQIGEEHNPAVDQLLFNVIQAVSNEPVKYGVVDESPVSATLIMEEGQPTIGKDSNPPPLTDLSGLPIRSDFNIRLGQKATDSQNIWNPNEVARPDLTMINGYVDLVYRDLPHLMPQQMQQYGQPFLNPEINKFVPRAVITKLDVLTDIVNSEMVLLALSTISFVKYNENWLEAFHPRASHDDVNIRDITAIGYESPIMGSLERLDAQGLSDITKLNQLLLGAIEPNLLISLDYDEASEQSWMLSDFYHAAVGANKQSDPAAVENIIRAANRLTHGKFSTIWDTSQPIAFDEDNRIALGYWIDNRSEKRDLRELDYLAMLNFLGDRDHSRIKDWDDTFNSGTGIPLDVRLERRERIAREILSSYTLKGWARRLVINARFLETLTSALASAGLIPTLESAVTDLTGRTMRGNPAILGLAMNNNPATMGVFSAGRSHSQFAGIGSFNYHQGASFRGFGQ